MERLRAEGAEAGRWRSDDDLLGEVMGLPAPPLRLDLEQAIGLFARLGRDANGSILWAERRAMLADYCPTVARRLGRLFDVVEHERLALDGCGYVVNGRPCGRPAHDHKDRAERKLIDHHPFKRAADGP